MAFKSLGTVAIKRCLNTFLYRPSALKAARKRLDRKVLRVIFKDFSSPLPLVLFFREEELDVLSEWKVEANSTIITYISMLPKLRENQKLVMLIRNGEIKLEGDFQVLQNFVSLLEQAEFDPVELLAPYISDIAAEGINKLFRNVTMFFRKGAERHYRYFVDAVTEEWRIAPGPLEAAWFKEKNSLTARAIEVFEKRLEKLEGK